MNYLISFGDDRYRYRKLILRKEAELSGWFDDIIIHSPDTIKDFLNQHKRFVEKNNKGHGYWIWKPYIILEQLKKMEDGDILVYLDSGASILEHKKQRFDEYKKLLDTCDKPIITFGNEIAYKERYFQKMSVLKRFNLDDNEDFLNSGQIEAGVFICKKSEFSINFVSEWMNLLIENNYSLVNDEDDLLQDKEFLSHRHDQSILSILCKMHETILLSLMECYGCGPFFSSRQEDIGLRERAPDSFRKEKDYNADKHLIWNDYLKDEVVREKTIQRIKNIIKDCKEDLIFYDINYDLKNEFVRRVFKKIEDIQFRKGWFKIHLTIDEFPENIILSKEKIIGEFYCEHKVGSSNQFNFVITSDSVTFPKNKSLDKRLYKSEYIRTWDNW